MKNEKCHQSEIWWATKTRYPPYIDFNGGQQKHVTHPTLILMVGNKNMLPTPT